MRSHKRFISGEASFEWNRAKRRTRQRVTVDVSHSAAWAVWSGPAVRKLVRLILRRRPQGGAEVVWRSHEGTCFELVSPDPHSGGLH